VRFEINDTSGVAECPAFEPKSTLGSSHIPAMFATQVALHPDGIAVAFNHEYHTYRQLDAWTDSVARALIAQGLQIGDRVGVYLSPTTNLVVALLGVLKAGGIYVPLDPEYPSERLALILNDSQAKIIVTDKGRKCSFAGPDVRTLSCGDVGAYSDDDVFVLPDISPSCGAYIIYTSGSTGSPKGVLVSHRNVVAFLEGVRGARVFDYRSGDVWTLFHSFAFDYSVWELWGCLLSGGCLVIVPRQTKRDPDEFHTLLSEEGVRILSLCPSELSQLVSSVSFAGGGLNVGLLICGGEPLDCEILVPWMNQYAEDVCQVANVYGVTEATVLCTMRALSRSDVEVGNRSIGKALPGWGVYVLDKNGKSLPVGAVGEIYVGGDGVAHGYWNQPKLTAQRFIADHISGTAGARLYRCGDLGRRINNEEFEYLGRTDDQIKIRGHRLELGEIRTALLRLSEVKAAAIVVRDKDDPAMARIDAYVVTSREIDGLDIRRQLLEYLPVYLIPATVTPVRHLPLTVNGKLDIRSLPIPQVLINHFEEFAGGPHGLVEEVLCGLFAQVLGLERVSPGDSFFDLGGHSLLAVRLVNQVRSVLDADLALPDVFEAPSPRLLAARLDYGAGGEGPVAVPHVPCAPASHAQVRLWLVDQVEGSGPSYNVPFVFDVEGPVDAGALGLALQDVVARHEILRTCFEEHDGLLVQRILEPCHAGSLLTTVEAGPSELPHAIGEAAGHVFDLAAGVPVHAWLIRSGRDLHTLVLTVHHIACDGWSARPFFRDLSMAYESRIDGRTPEYPVLPLQYADYAIWEQRVLGDAADPGSILSRRLARWRSAVRDLPAEIPLPRDHPRPAVPSNRGAAISVEIDAVTTQLLEQAARDAGGTLFMALQGAVAVLLSRHGAGTDIPLGTVTAGRPDAALDDIIGFFVNTLVLRTDLSGGPTYRQLLERVRRANLAAYACQDLPFDYLVDDVNPPRAPGRNPLFQAAVVYDAGDSPGLSLRGARSELRAAPVTTAKFDLTFSFTRKPNAVTATLEYATDIFSHQTASMLLQHLKTLLAALPATPDTPVTRIDFLTDEERNLLLNEWSLGVARGDNNATLSQLFEAQAARDPSAVALVSDDSEWTYGELNGRANQLARVLVSRGVGPGTIVALALPRSFQLIVSILAVLKAGGAYAPIDLAYPPERTRHILSDCRPACLLLSEQSWLREDLRSLVPLIMDSGGVEYAMSALPSRNLSGIECLDFPHISDVAYVIYTSGSTGKPKGVLVTHQGIASMVRSQLNLLGVTESSVVLQFASPGFDAMVFELCLGLLTGARLVLASGDSRLPGNGLSELTRKHGVTHALLTPTVLSAIDADGLPSIQTLMVGGEVCQPEMVSRWASKVTMVNLYGPTEATVFATASRSLTKNGDVPIGRAIENARTYVLDEYLQPVPVGVPGELYVAGLGLALGYLNSQDLTATRFVADVNGKAGARMYRTGDIVQWTWSGELAFVGRADRQVKVRGFRVEVGEVESALIGLEQVGNAVVLTRNDRHGAVRLVAYVVAIPGRQVNPAEVRRQVSRVLPDYMVPSAVVTLDTLPVTPNGKLDLDALPAPAGNFEEFAGGPHGLVEEVLCGLFAQVLGLERVSPGDSFFDLGGHSLLAVRLVNQVRSVLDADLALPDVFEAPSPRLLAARLDYGAGGEGPVAVPHVPCAPASHAQVRLWLVDQVEGSGPSYNVPFVFDVEGPVDAGALGLALQDVVARHEILRTCFEEHDGLLVQRILEPCHAGSLLTTVEAGPSELPHAIGEAAGHVFDLAAGVPVHAWLIRSGRDLHTLVLTVHHIACDGWSARPFFRDLSMAYESRIDGRTPEYPVLPLQYADYAIWEQRVLGDAADPGSILSRRLARWRSAVRDLPAEIPLPRDHPRPAVPSNRGAAISVEIDAVTTQLLEQAARDAGGTLFMALQGAVAVLLSRHGAGTDIPLGTVTAGRPDAALDDIIGFFVNTLVLRTDLSGGPTYRQLLERVRRANLAAYACQDLPFDYLVDDVNPPRAPGRNPLFQAAVVYDAGDSPGLSLRGARSELRAAPVTTAKFDLTFSFTRKPNAVTATLEYATDIFSHQTASMLLQHLKTLLAALPATPDTPMN
jgi:amino acid adenylation domain-containing protein